MSKNFAAAVATAATAIAFCVPAHAVDADAALALARQNNCLKCHAIDKDKDGPSYKKVAEKYKGKTVQIEGVLLSLRPNDDKETSVDKGTRVEVSGNMDYGNMDSVGFECYFEDNHKDELAKLSKGQLIAYGSLVFRGVVGNPRATWSYISGGRSECRGHKL